MQIEIENPIMKQSEIANQLGYSSSEHENFNRASVLFFDKISQIQKMSTYLKHVEITKF